MKNLVLVILLISMSFTLSSDALASKTSLHSKDHSINKLDPGDTYKLVFAEQAWWIYVYNQDGELVDIYPYDD